MSMFRKFPSYKQFDKMDCGPTCLKIISKYYGKDFSLNTLRDKCKVLRDGVSLLNIREAAISIGFQVSGCKVSINELCRDIILPCIIHWRQNHFVVLYKVTHRGGKYIFNISDPAAGLLKYDLKHFCENWNGFQDIIQGKGIVLSLVPTKKFYDFPDNPESISIKWLIEHVSPYKQAFIQILLALFLGSCISLILPFLTQYLIDIGIGIKDIGFVMSILIIQLLLTVFQMINDLIRNQITLHLTTRVSVTLISSFLIKMMQLPIAFFDTRITGDIIQRIEDHGRIQTFLTGTLINIIISLITFIVYLSLMGSYNLKILLIFFLGSVCYLIWAFVFIGYRKHIDYIRFQEQANNRSKIIQLINGMQEIKLNNCETYKRKEWESIQGKLFFVSKKWLNIGQIQQIGGRFIEQVKNILISFTAANSVISGEITLGVMSSIIYIGGQLNAPLAQFIKFIQDAQDAKISLERMNEIHTNNSELLVGQDYVYKLPEQRDIVLENVSFSYGGSKSKTILNNINAVFPVNKTTAIVGLSGSGKTTLLKLILGFYSPTGGRILIGDLPLHSISPVIWRKECGTVMQDGYIFSDTILNNIGLTDEKPDYNNVIKSARIANIDEYINLLPLKYDTKIGMEGNNISAGQKQRILIARAIYKNAKYLFLDEATNSLDTTNEKIISNNLKSVFKNRTVIIIAHRLSTVMNADNIIVLHNGNLVEQGKHNELCAKKGQYFNLVKDQLELNV